MRSFLRGDEIVTFMRKKADCIDLRMNSSIRESVFKAKLRKAFDQITILLFPDSDHFSEPFVDCAIQKRFSVPNEHWKGMA